MTENEIIETIRLRAERLDVGVRLSEDMRVMKDSCIMTGDMILRVMNKICVRDVENIEYRWPSDWKQAVKQRFAPKWFLKKHPVRYTVKGHKVMVHYPDFDILNTNKDSVVVVIKRQSYD